MKPGPLLKIKLLGSFEVGLDGGPTIEIGARKTRAMLAYLAVNPGRAQTRERLVGLLWSDRGDAQARNSMRQALSELGRAFDAIQPTPLVKERDTIQLAPDAIEVDVREFERLAASDDAADLDRAIALHGGDLLEGIDIRDPAFEEWLVPERQRLREIFLAVLAKRLAQARGQTAIGLAQRLLALDPLREEGHRALMRLHAEAGEVGAALRQYETCRAILGRELDVAPSPETEELHRRIRQQKDQPAAIAPAVAVEPTPAGDAAKPSLAVLPFRNLSDDPTQLYFSDGITEDIITELARFHELFVIARNSSFQFRDQPKDAKVIARELGVAYLVEGSVRKAGTRIRVAAQLIEAESGNNLWAERYDRDLDDIFAVQDEVVRTIVATLVGRVVASGADKARKKPAKDWVAYDFFLQGRERSDQHDSRAAEPLLRRAIELDPGFAQAHAWLSFAYTTTFFFTADKELLTVAGATARQALSLDSTDASSHVAMGLVDLFMRRHEEAGIHLATAISLNPTDAHVVSTHAVWLSFVDRTGEALDILEKTLQRDPYVPDWHWEMRSAALMQARRYEEAIQALVRMKHKLVWNHYLLAGAYAYLGRMNEARAQAAEVLRLKPDYSEDWVRAIEPYKDPIHVEHLLTGLRLAGLPTTK